MSSETYEKSWSVSSFEVLSMGRDMETDKKDDNEESGLDNPDGSRRGLRAMKEVG